MISVLYDKSQNTTISEYYATALLKLSKHFPQSGVSLIENVGKQPAVAGCLQIFHFIIIEFYILAISKLSTL